MNWIFVAAVGLLVVSVLLGALARFLKTPSGKGALGEALVGATLARVGDEWKILHDLTFVMDGESTQIDHVAISRFGVFVIETKNYSGKIFGKPGEPKWTQVLGRLKSQFQNPLRQNYRHTKFLSETLGVREEFMIPIVVFLKDASFPNGKPEGVLFVNEIKNYMISFTVPRLNNAQMEGIRMKLVRLGETTTSKTIQHLEILNGKRPKAS